MVEQKIEKLIEEALADIKTMNRLKILTMPGIGQSAGFKNNSEFLNHLTYNKPKINEKYSQKATFLQKMELLTKPK